MTSWLGGPIIDCPFGLCSARVQLVIEQARPENDEETVKRIPIHEIAGLSGYRGPCPASLMGMPLEGAAEELLYDEELRIARIVAGNPPPPLLGLSPTPEHSKTPHPNTDRSQWFGKGSNAGGRPTENNGPAAQGYPRLPFDAMGPGIPASLTSTGGNVSDNMRDQLRALTHLAIQGFGQEQELCSLLTARLDDILTLIAHLGEKHVATHQVAVAAVGGVTENLPEAAGNMIGSSNAAGDTIDGAEGVAHAIDLARTRTEAIFGSLHAAAEAGTTYLSTI